jgi:YVTN family beta-propeller protein
MIAGPANAHQVVASSARTSSTGVYPAAGEPDPIGVGAAPKSVAIAPNGEYAYVANVNGHTVSKIRTTDNTVVETIPVGQYPRDVSVRWDNAEVAVASATQGVTEIQVASSPASVAHYATTWPIKAVEYRWSQFRLLVKDSDALWTMWPGDDKPTWLARDNWGGESGLCNLATVWVKSDFQHVVSAENSNEVLWINSDYNFITRTPVGARPCGIAASPDGRSAYVANQGSNNVSRINLTTKLVTHTIPVGTNPSAVAFSPDGAFVYVTNFGSNSVSRINTATNTVDATFPVGNGPSDIAVAPDGSFAYVTNWSDNTVTRLNLTPGAPSVSSVTPGDTQASVAFDPPAANGSDPISNYQYSIDNGATWVTRSPASAASPLVIGGLTNGTTYQVKLRAVNPAGPGAASAGVAVTPRTVPGAPTGLVATPGNGQASIAFTAPANNGGAAITNYEYSLDNGATWVTRSPASAASPLVITGLTNGTTYQVKLRAVNPAGPGAASAAVAVTPRTVPGAPTGLVATPGNGQASIAFTPPASNGGAGGCQPFCVSFGFFFSRWWGFGRGRRWRVG